ncbi:MAG: DUF4270 family protein [Bacteroidota bacterium]
MKKKDLWVVVVIMITVALLSSCTAWENEMGQDLLPPGDKVFLFHDTIFDIHAYPVSGKRQVSSEWRFDPATKFLLGQLEDTIVGSSEATLFTQFNSSPTFEFITGGTEIDTILLHLYIADYFGNKEGEVTIRVHEAIEPLFLDSLYYSDFDAEGKFDLSILGETTYIPSESDTLEILIDNQAFIQKFMEVTEDTIFRNDSLFKDYFNGLYLTATSIAEEGAMAQVGLSDAVSRLTLRYYNDSTEVDTIAGKEFVWATFPISQYSQKINLFEHDHSNTFLAGIIDRDSMANPCCYVQGMAGVDTRLSFTNLEEWMEQGKVAINSAKLIFEVVPGEISGIPLEELPYQLMLRTELDDGTLEPTYDYIASGETFGGALRTDSKGMFQDTSYIYRFNMNLHFQSMVDGAKTDNNFRLYLPDAATNPKISKLWSNLPANPSRIRLEVVYLKL